MAGPVPTYLATQQAAQTAFTVSFGLLAFVNAAIAAATARGEFNTTVDCSLFITDDVSNLRIYLDSLGYNVDYAKGTNNKSLNIDWGRFRDTPGTSTTVYQGTVPWIISGTVDQGAPGASPWLVSVTNAVTVNQGTSPWVVTGTITTSPDVNIHDSAGNTLSSSGGALDVNVVTFPGTVSVTQGTSPWVIAGSVSVSNFPAVQPVSGTVTALQGTSPWVVAGTVTADAGTGTFLVDGSAHIQPVSQSGVWSVGRTWALTSGTDSVTVVQGTSPWVVSGTVVTSPDVNIHTSTGGALTATGTALDVNVTNFPATVAVTQSTSPWVVSGTVAATQSGTWTVQQGTPPWSVSVTNFPAVQPVSGTVTALQGTSPWVVSGTVAATQSGVWTTGRTWTLSTTTDSVSTNPVVSSSSAVTRLATSTTPNTIAANASRKQLIISTEAGIHYVLLGIGTVSSTNYTAQLTANSYYEVPTMWTGVVSIVKSTGTGNAQVTEIS